MSALVTERITCPLCRGNLFRDNCDVSSHGFGCDCKSDYYYCPNQDCPQRSFIPGDKA
jgi:hypothetical protein